MQFETSVAAGGSNTNFFNGSAFEYARGRMALSMGITAAATGTFISVQSGADIILEESPPFVLTTFPVMPDHMVFNDIMEPFDRLRVSARNPTGGAVIHRGIALLTQI
jgi:hypothetical protein